MLIKRFKWWLGYALIRLGWRIYMSGYTNTGNCVGMGIQENGISYNIEFIKGEREGVINE